MRGRGIRQNAQVSYLPECSQVVRRAFRPRQGDKQLFSAEPRFHFAHERRERRSVLARQVRKVEQHAVPLARLSVLRRTPGKRFAQVLVCCHPMRRLARKQAVPVLRGQHENRLRAVPMRQPHGNFRMGGADTPCPVEAEGLYR